MNSFIMRWRKSPVEGGGKHPTIYRVSSILLVVQDFTTIHNMFGFSGAENRQVHDIA